MIVMVAGLVIIGGSAVGGIAFAASRTTDSPIHPQVSPSDDRGGQRAGDNDNQGRDEDTATPAPSASCAADPDKAAEVTGDRHGVSTAPEDSATGGDHRGGSSGSGSSGGSGQHRDGTDDSSRSVHDACDDD
jgi:hypothetical protein